MLLAIRFYDVVVAIHVAAIVAAFGVVAAYPVVLPWLRGAHPEAMPVAHRVQGRLGRALITPAATLALLAGVYLASSEHLWSKVWVVIPFVILVVLLGLSGAVFAPAERRLAELAAAGVERPEYDAAFRRLVGLQAGAFGLVLVAIFFMVTKAGG